jgi:hypothetical protein
MFRIEMAIFISERDFHFLFGMSPQFEREKEKKMLVEGKEKPQSQLRHHHQRYNVPFRFEFLLTISVLSPSKSMASRENY